MKHLYLVAPFPNIIRDRVSTVDTEKLVSIYKAVFGKEPETTEPKAIVVSLLQQKWHVGTKPLLKKIKLWDMMQRTPDPSKFDPDVIYVTEITEQELKTLGYEKNA